MKFIQHYSSSRSNLYEVVAGSGRRLLLECGVRWPVLQKALHYNLNNIEGCLLTHEHQDHSRAVEDIMRAGIDVYASDGTFEALGIIDSRKAIVVDGDSWFDVGNTFGVFCFHIEHDAQDPHGYIVRDGAMQEYLLFVPDSGFIKQRFDCKFSIIALECSYDIEILRRRVDTKEIHTEVAKRMVKSHAEKNTTLNYLQNFCDLSGCREIHLLHTSGDNLNKKATKLEFEKKLFIETVIL